MRIKRIVSTFLALALIFSCITSYGGTEKATQENKIHYLLLWSNYHTWEVSSGKWDHVEPGGKAIITESVTLPENAKVEGVYTLRKENNTGISKEAWEKFDFYGETSEWNNLEFIQKIDNEGWNEYNDHYSKYDVKDFTLVSTNQSGTKFTYKYEYTLKTDNPDSKHKGKGYYLTSKDDQELAKVESWLGGWENVKGTVAWNKIKEMEKTKTKKTGYCYWVPYVIKYTVGEAYPASLTDPNAKNLIMEKVTFLDKNKKTVSKCEKGKEYYAKFLIKYVGEDMDSKKKVVIKDVKAKATKEGSVIYSELAKKEGEVQKKNGEEFSVTYGPFTATEDTIYACATIEYSEEVNQITTDDFGEGWLNGEEATTPGAITEGGIITPPGVINPSGEKEDLAIKIERVTPATTKIYAPNEFASTPYNVDCVITYYTNEDAGILSTARIKIPDNQNVGKTYSEEISVNLEPGQNRISFAIPSIIVRNKTGGFNIEATVNDRHEYPKEEKTWDNNKDTIKQPIVTIASKNTNPCADAPHTMNRGKVLYKITTRKGATYSCKTITNEKTGTEKRVCGCKGGTYKEEDQVSTRTEMLNLTDIHFISKQSNVNLINSKGKIKAGYGFELNITAVLTGTESPGRPTDWSSGCNYQRVSPGKFQLSQLTNRIFVVLPDGQIISNVASGAIKEQMECSVSSNGDRFGGTVMRCRVKTGNTFGNKETNKLYVDENTKNGTYQMTVCTEKVQPKVGEIELYDRKIVYYEVDGSYTDDVVTHIIQ